MAAPATALRRGRRNGAPCPTWPTVSRTRGADLHAAAAAGGHTPLSLAQALRAAGDADAAEGSATSLVLAAAEPWGPRTHALFPAAARGFAAELLLLGHQLSRQPHFTGEEVALVDVWTHVIMPSAVLRSP